MLGLASESDGTGWMHCSNSRHNYCMQTLSLLFAESYHLVRSQTEKLKQLKAELSSTKSQLIENQKWVISLQEQLINCKDKQLEGVETVVKSSVENNLKEQFKSYSEAAAENVMVCKPEGLTDPETLKKVVKSVVQEEDRSRNVVIFGLPEMKEENVEELCKRYLRRSD